MHLMYIEKSTRLSWGKTEGYSFPSGYPVHSIMMGWIYAFGSKSSIFWPLSQYVGEFYCSFGFLLPLPGCKGCAITKRQFSSVWLLNKIPRQRDTDDLWFARIPQHNFAAQKKKNPLFKELWTIICLLIRLLTHGGPQPSGWKTGK